MRDLDAVDQPLAASGQHGEDPEVELVEEAVREQRAVELAGAELEQVLARLLLQRRDSLGSVALDDRCVPGGVGERPRGDVLGHLVDPVGVGVAAPLRPGLREALVRRAAEEERVRREEQLARVGGVLVVPVGRAPLLGRVDHAVQGHEGRFDELSHRGAPWLAAASRSSGPRARTPRRCGRGSDRVPSSRSSQSSHSCVPKVRPAGFGELIGGGYPSRALRLPIRGRLRPAVSRPAAPRRCLAAARPPRRSRSGRQARPPGRGRGG